MSLTCCECNQTMAPSRPMPGSDGVMTQPVVWALVPVVSEDGKIKSKASLVLAQNGRSLCFRCIEAVLEKNPQSGN